MSAHRGDAELYESTYQAMLLRGWHPAVAAIEAHDHVARLATARRRRAA